MATTRDLTQAQFIRAMKSHGFVSEGFMGYWRLPLGEKHICVSALNGGPKRRAQLAYMLRELDRNQREQEIKGGAA